MAYGERITGGSIKNGNLPAGRRKTEKKSARGGADRDTIQRIENIERSRGSFENYGLVMLSESSSVTEAAGKALPAREKNAALPGTMANRTAAQEAVINRLKQPETIESDLGLKETLLEIFKPEKFMDARNRKFVLWNPQVFGWYVADITMWGGSGNWNFNGILYPNTNQDGYLFHYHSNGNFELWKISNGPDQTADIQI